MTISHIVICVHGVSRATDENLKSLLWSNLIKEHACGRDIQTHFELIFHNNPTYAVGRQTLFWTFCAHAQKRIKTILPFGPKGQDTEKHPSSSTHSAQALEPWSMDSVVMASYTPVSTRTSRARSDRLVKAGNHQFLLWTLCCAKNIFYYFHKRARKNK